MQYLGAVSCALVNGGQPYVPEGEHRIGVRLGLGVLENAFEFLLARPPFLLDQVQIAYQCPRVGMTLWRGGWRKLKMTDVRI